MRIIIFKSTFMGQLIPVQKAPILEINAPVLLTADKNPVLIYLGSLSNGSRRTMKQSLDAIANLISTGAIADSINFPWWLLRYQHTAVVRSQLALNHSSATANKMLSAVKGVLKECRRLGLMSADDLVDAIDFKRIKGQSLPAGRMLSPEEIKALFQSCCEDKTAAGHRDAAMLAVMLSGLRRSEVVKLEVRDVDSDSGEIIVRGGKGNKDATTYLQSGAEKYISSWLAVRGDIKGALFNPVSQKGEVSVGRGMTDQTVMNMLMKRAKLAGVKDVSPHDFRRTFISNLFDANVDGSTVQALARHSNFATTVKYDRRGDRAKRKAAASLSLP